MPRTPIKKRPLSNESESDSDTEPPVMDDASLDQLVGYAGELTKTLPNRGKGPRMLSCLTVQVRHSADDDEIRQALDSLRSEYQRLEEILEKRVQERLNKKKLEELAAKLQKAQQALEEANILKSTQEKVIAALTARMDELTRL